MASAAVVWCSLSSLLRWRLEQQMHRRDGSGGFSCSSGLCSKRGKGSVTSHSLLALVMLKPGVLQVGAGDPVAQVTGGAQKLLAAAATAQGVAQLGMGLGIVDQALQFRPAHARASGSVHVAAGVSREPRSAGHIQSEAGVIDAGATGALCWAVHLRLGHHHHSPLLPNR